MALLGIDDLLADPLFNADFGRLFLINSVETVDQHGRTQKVGTQIPIVGSVQPADGEALQILQNVANVTAGIEVFTTMILKPATATNAADVILWQDQPYMVHHVDDYRSYGGGHVVALCALLPPVAT